MRTRLIIALCVLGLSQFGSAYSASITFVPTSSTNVAPGGTVNFDIYGSSINAIGAFSLFLNSTDTATNLQLTSFNLNTTLFSYFGSNPTFPEVISTTQTSQDLGAFTNDPNGIAANTQYFLGNAVLTVGINSPLGAYSIDNTTGTVFTDPTFTMSDNAPDSNFVINVTSVPEPSSWGLLLGGSLGALLIVRIHRRRSLPLPARG